MALGLYRKAFGACAVGDSADFISDEFLLRGLFSQELPVRFLERKYQATYFASGLPLILAAWAKVGKHWP
jgi:hypothetical protein